MRQKGSRARAGKGKAGGELWDPVEPWEAMCHPGFSLPCRREERGSSCI